MNSHTHTQDVEFLVAAHSHGRADAFVRQLPLARMATDDLSSRIALAQARALMQGA